MDNERPIEKLLRRYAKKRRDDPATTKLELHPATRRMLQGEVSRQFPKPAAGEKKSLLGLKSLWPRLVWALPVLVVLGVGVWAIVQSRRPHERMADFAKLEPSAAPVTESQARTETPAQAVGGISPPQESGPATLAYSDALRMKDSTGTLSPAEAKLKADRGSTSAVNAPAPSAAAPAPEVARLDRAVQEEAIAGRDALERVAREARADKSRDLTLAERQAPARGPAASTTENVEVARALRAATTEDSRVSRKVGSRTGTAGSQIAGGSARAIPPPADPPSLSLSTKPVLTRIERDRVPAAPETVVQKFVQTTAVMTSGSQAKKIAETPPVLDTFQLEQTGNQLRVIDSDGSSYSGSIQFATADALYDAARETKKTGDFKNAALYGQTVGQKGLEAQAGQNYFFTVAGTNRTLKQSVAFTGNLLVLTNVTSGIQNGVTLAPTAKSQFPQSQSASPDLLNSSISGKVQLGADTEMRINAVPARQ